MERATEHACDFKPRTVSHMWRTSHRKPTFVAKWRAERRKRHSSRNIGFAEEWSRRANEARRLVEGSVLGNEVCWRQRRPRPCNLVQGSSLVLCQYAQLRQHSAQAKPPRIARDIEGAPIGRGK